MEVPQRRGEPPEQDLPRPPSAQRPPPRWVPDSTSASCMVTGCGAPFRRLFDRHHCRRCGLLVCSKCSQGRARPARLAGVPTAKWSDDWAESNQRCCDACVERPLLGGGEPLAPGPRPTAEDFAGAGEAAEGPLQPGAAVRLRWVDRASGELFLAPVRADRSGVLFGSEVLRAVRERYASPGAGTICAAARRGPPSADAEWPDWDMRDATPVTLAALPLGHVFRAGPSAAAAEPGLLVLDLAVDTETGVPVSSWFL